MHPIEYERLVTCALVDNVRFSSCMADLLFKFTKIVIYKNENGKNISVLQQNNSTCPEMSPGLCMKTRF